MARETEHATRRALTPDEEARRKAMLAGDDPAKARAAPVQTSEYGGPYEGYTSRLERGNAAVKPEAVDYDRDGYPDAVVGRAGRNYTGRAKAANGINSDSPAVALVARRGGSYGGVYSIGRDGYRQDQVGYRERLRGRLAAAVALEEAAEEAEVDARVQDMARAVVVSHGGTGVGGGLPAVRIDRPADTRLPGGSRARVAAAQQVLTATEQALIAPRTERTGFENRGAQKVAVTIPHPRGEGRDAEEAIEGIQTPSHPGNMGPDGTTRRASMGSVPVQGTLQPDGGFVVGELAETDPYPEAPPDDEPASRARHAPQGKPAAPNKTDEHSKAHEPIKPHASVAGHEPGKPHEHKPPDHGKK